jgi:hypothetical protein
MVNAIESTLKEIRMIPMTIEEWARGKFCIACNSPLFAHDTKVGLECTNTDCSQYRKVVCKDQWRKAQEQMNDISKSSFAPPPGHPVPTMQEVDEIIKRHTKDKESIANEKQYGGTHYKKMAIEPWDFIAKNNIGYLDGSAIKYLSRWRDKNGIEDLKKAIHFIEKLIEVETHAKQSIDTPNDQATT